MYIFPSTFIEILKTMLKLLLGRGVRKSYAQNGEDVLIQSLVGSKKNGMYVDVGAFHPIQYSNTYSLYRQGWNGIAIDPNPRVQSLFKFFRPRDKFIQSGVILNSGSMKYYSFKDPAYNTMSDVQADEWKKKGIDLGATYTVPCRTLADILKEQKVRKIDVLSVDVEGLDLEVLQSHDWDIPTEIVVVESHTFDRHSPGDDPVYSYLIVRGYILVSRVHFSLIFSKKSLLNT